jgi:hypothetical protein
MLGNCVRCAWCVGVSVLRLVCPHTVRVCLQQAPVGCVILPDRMLQLWCPVMPGIQVTDSAALKIRNSSYYKGAGLHAEPLQAHLH